MSISILAKLKGTFVRVQGVDETTTLAANDVIGQIRRQLNGELVDVLTEEAGTFLYLYPDETIVKKNGELAIIEPLPVPPAPPTPTLPQLPEPIV